MATARKKKALVIKEITKATGFSVTSPKGNNFTVTYEDGCAVGVDASGGELCSMANNVLEEVLNMNEDNFNDLVETIKAVRTKAHDMGLDSL